MPQLFASGSLSFLLPFFLLWHSINFSAQKKKKKIVELWRKKQSFTSLSTVVFRVSLASCREKRKNIWAISQNNSHFFQNSTTLLVTFFIFFLPQLIFKQKVRFVIISFYPLKSHSKLCSFYYYLIWREVDFKVLFCNIPVLSMSGSASDTAFSVCIIISASFYR